MAGDGRPEAAHLNARGLSLGIAVTAWNREVVDQMLDRALTAAQDAGLEEAEVVRVAGAVELPVVAQALARRFDAVVALGVVIRGGTAHFEYVNRSVTDGLTRVALDESTPVAHGVLTVENQQQALDRAGYPDSKEDKGFEAVQAALGTALELTRLRQL
ncbi:6,7-dimethyl-8-ribityllumazine synthase [Haloglycomyces albus]|uniref:6,7-dimethyl-8-ribityllumazine synthase n=1 Tax=Haloglycomyces albus TaxID=526067 RepID=UPI00046CB43F|nr:6,7-dimethyl-8-ribityllumazine synthase [Haloglycomyces albus]